MTNTDYSAMSDFEINKRVAERKGFAETALVINGQIDYCNKPGYAWPIIQENEISLNYDGISWQASSWCDDSRYDDWRNHPESPLRIAMILFLMMLDEGAKDEKNKI